MKLKWSFKVLKIESQNFQSDEKVSADSNSVAQNYWIGLG